DRRALTVDYRSRRPGPIEGKWKGDCVSIDAPGRTKGRIWVDETTNDVLRLDESLTAQFEYRIPREHWGINGPQTWVVERADSSIRYKTFAFHEPEETVLLPESIQSLTIFRGAQSYRINQTFSDYRRFLAGGRGLERMPSGVGGGGSEVQGFCVPGVPGLGFEGSGFSVLGSGVRGSAVHRPNENREPRTENGEPRTENRRTRTSEREP